MSNGASKARAPRPDPRFAAIATDPRYRLPSTKSTRVGVDKRFARMFRDDDFTKQAKVDRYGRRVEGGEGEKLASRLYQEEGPEAEKSGTGIAPASDEEEEGEEEEEEEEEDKEAGDSDAAVEKELRRVGRTTMVRDPAREGGFSSSSEDDSSDDEEDDVDVEDDAELADGRQGNDVPMGEVSSRLGVVNLDWDHIRATDLMAVAQSFVPTSGYITHVVVYPSEFGKQRIEREELEGPPRDIFASSKQHEDEASTSEDSENEEERIKKRLQGEDQGEEFDSAKLRQYQLDRLKYYYAVITCDSHGTAKALYDSMDGREYLTTANFFDLRFIPDEVSFDDDKPRDECKQLPAGYRPNEFVTEALTHSKVRLTWDDDDTTRKEVQKRAFSRAEIDENDLQAYIGTDSSEDEGDSVAQSKADKADAQRQKMRAALGLAAESAKASGKKADGPVGDMQITFSSGLSGAAKGNGVFENEPITDETTKERYIRKERERKAARRDKAKAARSGVEGVDGGAEQSPEPEEGQPASVTAEGDGFDDPFFTDMPAAQKAEKDARKAAKAKKRAERAEVEKATAAQRAELELLMVNDKEDNMRHFNMNEIRKAEKEKKRKGKKGAKAQAADHGKTDGDEQGFVMETQDPRFASLFNSHEYAIDPTNPRFKGTSGMKALLDEGRKKRKAGVEDVPGVEEVAEGKKAKRAKKVEGQEVGEESQDLQKLLAKVKGRASAKGGRKG